MSAPTERVLASLREHGYEPRRVGAGWCCRCPAHEDREPSLTINVGDDGRALLHCFAGCSNEAICGAIGLRLGDLFEPKPGGRNGRARDSRQTPLSTTGHMGAPAGDPANVDAPNRGRTFPTARDAVDDLERRRGPRSATWTYHDALGDPVGLVLRWDLPPAEPGGEPGKDVLPVSKTPEGWIIGGMPKPRPLYSLPDLLATPAGARIYVTEGEKAADAARALGLVATTSPHGSQSAAKTDWSPLCGRNVVILPDHDDAGDRYADDVARLATAAAALSVRVVRPIRLSAELPEGGDLADLVEHCGGDLDALEKLRADIDAMADKTATTKPASPPINGAPVVVRLADVRPEPVAWLWPGRFALGKLTLIAGDPGLGKSFLTLDMASRVSTGTGWPDGGGERFAPGGVVLLSAEDAIADTIRPRLDAAGADVRRIVALEAIQSRADSGRESIRAFDLSRDLPALELAIRLVDACRLVVIDPVTAYLGGIDSHKNADIRALLAPLGALATRHRVAVVAVTHLNKSAGGLAIYRLMGSLAFAAAARSAWAVAKDRVDPRRRLMLPIKNNIAPDTGGLAYRIESSGVDGCPLVTWEPDPVDASAEDALSGDLENGGGRTERDDAADWLRNVLADGPRPARDMERDAREAGFSLASVRRAKAAIGVASRKAAFGGPWEWVLPSEDSQPAKMRTPSLSSVSVLGSGARNGDSRGSDLPFAPEDAHPEGKGSPEHLGPEGDKDNFGAFCSDHPEPDDEP